MNKKAMSLKLTKSRAYKKAYADNSFMSGAELRPLRLQLELLKTEVYLKRHEIESTIVMFGSARLDSKEDCLLKIKDNEL